MEIFEIFNLVFRSFRNTLHNFLTSSGYKALAKQNFPGYLFYAVSFNIQ